MSSRNIVAVVVILAATGAGVGIASGTGSPSTKRESGVERGVNDSRQQAQRNAADEVSASPSVKSALNQYVALRAPTTKADSLTGNVLQMANIMTRGEPFTVHTVESRPTFKLFVLQTANSLCIYQRNHGGGAGGCTDDMTGFVKGGMNYGPEPGGGYRITAFLPDGVKDVAFIDANGTKDPLTLSNNLASVVFGKLPTSAQWTLPDGSTETQTFTDMNADARSQAPEPQAAP